MLNRLPEFNVIFKYLSCFKKLRTFPLVLQLSNTATLWSRAHKHTAAPKKTFLRSTPPGPEGIGLRYPIQVLRRRRNLPHACISSAQYPGCITIDNTLMAHHPTADTALSSDCRVASRFHQVTPPRGNPTDEGTRGITRETAQGDFTAE